MGIIEKFKNAWNIFSGRSPTRGFFGWGDSMRPDQIRYNTFGIRSMVNTAYTQIAVDCSSIDIKHVRLSEDKKYKETIYDSLNYALTKSANIDQTGRELIEDSVLKMLDYGCVAIVPIETDIDPLNTDSYSIYTLRAGKIVQWYPNHILVELYNEKIGSKQQILVEKRIAAVIQNPFYPIMNDANSTAQRLISVLNKLEEANANQTGKINIFVTMPYSIRDTLKNLQAKKRIKEIETQMVNNKYGITYLDSNEKVTQLNRQLENNLWEQAVELKNQLFNELGLTTAIFDGTANEQIMLNYQNRTLEPIMSAIVENMERKWITITAQTQGQAIRYFKNPFKLVPVAQIAEIADKFTRNEIMTSNEMRSVIGLEPIDDPKANELRNANLNHPEEEGNTSTVVDEVIKHHGIKGQQWGIRNGPPYPLNYSKLINKKKISEEGTLYSISSDKNTVMSELKTYDYKIDGFDWVLMADIQTEQNYRKRGLATQLINKAYEDISKSGKGAYLFVKKDNDNAIKLYKKLNFDILKEYDLENGAYLIMIKGDANKEQFEKMNFS